MATIKELIKIAEAHGLQRKTRKRDIVYKRYYIFSEMRKGLTFEQVGDMFGMNHSTVLYGVNQHELFMKQRDALYMGIISELWQEVNRFSITALSEKNMYMSVSHLAGPIVTLELQFTSTDPDWFLDNKGIIKREHFLEAL
jgi:hypothetical protein